MLKPKFYLKLSLFGVIMMMLSVIYGVSPQQAQADPNISPMFQDELPWITSSYEMSEEGVFSRCPDPAIFKAGTRVVYSYPPGAATKDNVPILIAWYELDDKGNMVSDEPFTIAEITLAKGEFPWGSVKYQPNTVANVAVSMVFQSPDDGEWYSIGVGTYRLASATEKVPEPGVCPAQ